MSKCKKTRIGDYRIICFIYESKKEVEIIDVDDVVIDPNKTIGELFESELENESIKMPELDNTIEEEPTVELSDLIDEKESIERKLQVTEDEEDDDTDLFSLIDSMYEDSKE